MEAYLGGPLRDTFIAAVEDNLREHDDEIHCRSQRFQPDSLFEHFEETLIMEGQKLFGDRPSRGAEYENLRKRRHELLAQRQALRLQVEQTTEEETVAAELRLVTTTLKRERQKDWEHFQDEVADGIWEAWQQRRMAAVQRLVRRVAGKK